MAFVCEFMKISELRWVETYSIIGLSMGGKPHEQVLCVITNPVSREPRAPANYTGIVAKTEDTGLRHLSWEQFLRPWAGAWCCPGVLPMASDAVDEEDARDVSIPRGKKACKAPAYSRSAPGGS